MTPAARVAAAAEILDEVGAVGKAETALKNWARGHRFAGSKDRAAIRDHVFDVLRAKRSLAALGGGGTGRALMLGLLRRQGADISGLFSGDGYGPTPLTPHEHNALKAMPEMSLAEKSDLPDWLWPLWEDDLGRDAMPVAQELQSRAPISLRVNLRRTARDAALELLALDGIETRPNGDVKTALQVIENERRIKISKAYIDGLVELQDVASQIAVAGFDLASDARVLDYCAGGGGKALAFADAYDAQVTAHDVAPQRMADLPERARRAGVHITIHKTAELPQLPAFDLVFCDAPCSGSGTWRRTPDAKWQMTQDKLNNYHDLQVDALSNAAKYVADDGTLVYATCSVLACENDGVVRTFLAAHPNWQVTSKWQLLPTPIHDGFFRAVLAPKPA